MITFESVRAAHHHNDPFKTWPISFFYAAIILYCKSCVSSEADGSEKGGVDNVGNLVGQFEYDLRNFSFHTIKYITIKINKSSYNCN